MDKNTHKWKEEITFDTIFEVLSDSEGETTFILKTPVHNTKQQISKKDIHFSDYFDALLEKIFSVCCFDNCNCCEKIKNLIINHQQFTVPPAVEDEIVVKVPHDFDWDSPLTSDLETNYVHGKSQNKIQILSNIQVKEPQFKLDRCNGTFKVPSAIKKPDFSQNKEDQTNYEVLSDKTHQVNESNLDMLFDELAAIKTQFELDCLSEPNTNRPAGNFHKKTKNNVRKVTNRTRRPREAKSLNTTYNEDQMFVLKENSPNLNALGKIEKRKSILKVDGRNRRNYSLPNLSRVTFDADRNRNTKNQKRRKVQDPKLNLKQQMSPGNESSESDKNSNKSPPKRMRKLYSPEDWINSVQFEKDLEVE